VEGEKGKRKGAGGYEVESPARLEMSLDCVTTESRTLPNRYVVYSASGWGKSSFAAQIPGCIFLMSKGEDGLIKLMEAGRLRPTPHFPRPADNYKEVVQAVSELLGRDHGYKTLVIDTINGVERMLMEQVCQQKFNNDWEQFNSFGRGVGIVLAQFNEFITTLERLRVTKGMNIMLLAHAKVAKAANPAGEDYDHWSPSLNDKCWEIADRWADTVLYGGRRVVVRENRQKKMRGVGGEQRFLATERNAWWAAKNRFGLPAEIDCGETAEEAWEAFTTAIREAKAASVGG
jgi:hypothetical protein